MDMVPPPLAAEPPDPDRPAPPTPTPPTLSFDAAEASLARSDVAATQRLLDDTLGPLVAVLDQPHLPARLLALRGRLALRCGQPEAACSALRDAVAQQSALGLVASLATSLEHLADAEAAAGRPDQALTALRQAVALLRQFAADTQAPATSGVEPSATLPSAAAAADGTWPGPARPDALHHLGHALDDAGRADYCVVRVDLDHFRRTSERHPATVVDHMLREVAGLLRSGCRQTDQVLHADHGQLVLVLDRCSAAQGSAHCERLRRAIATHDWPRLAAGLWVTASFGVAQAGTGQRFADVLAAAGARVYSAKRAGRNRVVA